ncbi:hypothetical protein [Streptomyces spinosisporus]|uniref:Uncharacterized protein n=1 Tax=Streptomyces spinosisporus TaxID=2927582 RepID=A0ABS9XDS0_9ACTN|nr:hypothetical protein [Streptomyces spinosisporus]MCI3240238.1 hypothetical protein [Streptomyces spinosisporus]
MTERSSAHDPLFGPNDPSPEPASLAVEIAASRRILDETAGLNIHDHSAMLHAAVSLNLRLRGVLAALDKERGGEGS